MDKENEISSGTQRRQKLRHEILRGALQERDQNTPDSSRKVSVFDRNEVKARISLYGELNPIKRSVSFANQSEARSFHSKDPAVELGEVTYLSTKTKTPPSRRVGLPAQTQGLKVPSIEESILEDDMAFSFLDRETIIVNNSLQEHGANKESFSEESALAVEQCADLLESGSEIASEDNRSTISSSYNSFLELTEEEEDLHLRANADSFLADVLDSHEHVAKIPLSVVLQQANHEDAHKLDNHSMMASSIHVLDHGDQVDGCISETEVEDDDDDSEFNLVGERCAAKMLHLYETSTVLSTELEEDNDDTEMPGASTRLATCSTTEEESFKESDAASLQRDLTKSTLVLSDEATEPENDAPATLMSVIPQEMLGELNVAYDLLHLANAVNTVASVTEHAKATVGLMTLDLDRYVSRKTLMKESGVETLTTTEVIHEELGVPFSKEHVLLETVTPHTTSVPELSSTKQEEVEVSPPTLPNQEDSVSNQQDVLIPVSYDGDFIFQDDIAFATIAEVDEQSGNRAITEGIEEKTQPSLETEKQEESEAETPVQPRRYPLGILRAETYEAPPSVIQQPTIDIAKLIHVCTFSLTSKLNRENLMAHKAHKSRKMKQYPVHTLAENTPVRHSPIDTLISGRVHKKSRY